MQTDFKNIKQLDYFCVLAGGGVRGTAYIGVLKYLEELDINIKGMAGSSVGAVFSALYLAGYKHEELKEMFFSINYEQFRDLYLPFGKEFGICKGDNFLNWFRNALESKFYGDDYREGKNPPITFKDLAKDLVVIATDVCSNSVKDFSPQTTPDVEVAHAVRASISIPGFFKPISDENTCLVDGDIVKNLPVWTFSRNIINNDTRVLEFRLEAGKCVKKINNPYDYFNAVVDAASSISTDFVINLYGQNDKYDFIKIDTENIGIIDFSISDEKKNWLIEKGYSATKSSFGKEISIKREKIKKVYSEILSYLKMFENYINRSKIKEAKIELGHVAVCMVKNKDILGQNFWQELVELKELFLQNICKSLILRNDALQNKEAINKSLSCVMEKFEKEVLVLEDFLLHIKDH